MAFREFGEEDHGIGVFFGRSLYYKIVNKNADKVVLISHALKNKYRQYIKNEKLEIIYDDLSADYINYEKRDLEANNCRKILVAGLICEGKGQYEVVRAVAKVLHKGINTELYIAGACVD